MLKITQLGKSFPSDYEKDYTWFSNLSSMQDQSGCKKSRIKVYIIRPQFQWSFYLPHCLSDTVFEMPVRYFISINIQVKLKMYYFEGNSIIIIIKL